ncbi:hypothetical protein OEA41_006411 [Lepraria neglecta]|uniref:Uncharacterized protein n=1 Tax=Lepraria neglecta TaxID=209136 RepID=A0AAE0DK70_9LECA|nr:hypothetical protein OEA41_006411 [Lepraria neglecta]
MAEWKARGYVVDSDEEDDSQNTLFLISASQNAFLNVDDAGDVVGNQVQDGEADAEEQTVVTSGNGIGEKEPEKVDIDDEEKATASPGHVEQEEQDIQDSDERGAVMKTGQTQYGVLSDHEDIDELQQDHYKATASAQLEAGFLQGFRNSTNQRQTISSSQDHERPARFASSSPLSGGSLGTQGRLPSVKVIVPTLKTQDSLADNSTDGEPDTPSPGRRIDQPNPTEPPTHGLTEPSRGTRNLRHRNPIQLHPYQIESEKYRQILKARGMKPLRIAQMEAEAASARREESQNLAYTAEESQINDVESGLEETGLSSPLRTQDSLTDSTMNAKDIFIFGDDDLPDVQTLLSNPPRKYIDNGYKRRKVTAPSFKIPPGFNLDNLPSKLAHRSSPLLEDDDIMFDVPPSPPHSGSQTPLEATRPSRPQFRRPRRTSSPALPTPVTSSVPPRRAVLDVSEDEESDHVSHGRSRPSSRVEMSDSSGSSSGNDSSHELQRAQRKIRGVLPASWLKLDLKIRSKKSGNMPEGRAILSPESGEYQRGVAWPVGTGGSKSPDLPKSQHGLIELSDEEDSVSQNDGIRQPLDKRPNNNSNDDDDDDEALMTGRLGEAMEDDRIDAMVPSTARPRARHRNEKKRQTKIRDFGSHPPTVPQSLPKKSRSHRPRQPKITDRFDRGHRRKPVFRPPRLSILDAPAMRIGSATPVPPFLKIASRTARSRQDKGRHSPSRKYLRLATKDDDYDASQTLRDWREGTIAPAPNDRIDTIGVRKPLYPRSANSQLPPITSDTAKKTEESRTPPSRSSHSRQQFRSTRPRKLQASLDHPAERQFGGRPGSSGGLEAARAHQSADKPKKRGYIVSNLRADNDSRPAMLESQREDEDGVRAQLVFERDLSRINHFDDGSGLPNVLRFFEEEGRRSATGNHTKVNHAREPQRITKAQPPTRKLIPHWSRKRRPQQVDVSASWSRHSSTSIALDNFPDKTLTPKYETGNKNALIGLGPFGTRYSDTFDTTPLPTGTCFHGRTIVGSGLFAKSLKLAEPNLLDSPRGFAVWTHGNRTFRWGPWNDTVSSEFGDVMALISQAVQIAIGQGQWTLGTSPFGQAISMLKEVVQYFSDHLSFLDSVDRISFLQRCKSLTCTLQAEDTGQNPDSNTSVTQAPIDQRVNSQILANTLSSVLLNQLRLVAAHKLVPRPLQDEVCSLTRKATQQTLGQALKGDLGAIDTCLSRFKQSDGPNITIGEEEHSIQAIVVAQHVLGQDSNGKTNAWEVLQIDVPAKSSNGIFDIQLLERSWKRLFILLPFFEFDAEGTLETGRRFKVAFDNWALVKRMIGPVLEASLDDPRGQPSSFNVYCRALFGRCLQLINGWGWRRCEAIIGTLFDFFARNNLAHLRNEESHGSPPFLARLDTSPALVAEPGDRCFHILLKIIGSGVRYMRRSYPEKKIRDLVWRLMPNHDRFHPKEEAIRQEDLDALRNHHDLLCTLYWASPPSCRPRLNVIRNLVQLETSHREACHINIRAWINLTTFQLSTEEPVDSLEPFAEWHDDLLGQILRQHALARTEAEDQVRSAQYAGGLTVSKELLESTIAGNQRQVEAILSDALVCLKLVIEAARDEKAAAMLMSPTLTKVFELFDARRPQANKVIKQALDVMSAYTSQSMTQRSNARDENDDSQDYGDWPAMDEDVDEITMAVNETDSSPLQNFQEPLRHLLSNCFGSDIVPDNSVLLKLVDVWIAGAQVLVRRRTRSWADYVGRFGNDSWSSLRDTEQTRKYTAYYLATLLEKDNNIYREHQTFFLTSWIGSLVERESLLKFQHRLTEALLNADSDNPIAKNLPFWADSTTGRFQITAAEFSERRLSIISSVLSNMRVSSEQAVFDPSFNSTQLRQGYKDLLKHLMATMKHNYQELGQGSNVRGAYVDFIHRVVELLQQHTSTVCPIDRFFTDNGAFPLPATDPTYVVGQLKNYALRLQDPRTLKQLAVFLQSVSERAAVDGQQPYLVGQLYAAMSNAFEDGVAARPTLRSFLVKATTPAYIELAFGQDSGWILALPYLQALQRVFSELLMDLDGTNVNSVAAVTSSVTVFLDSVRQSFGTLLYSSRLFEFPWILKTLSACYEAITALLPILDYLVRLSGPINRAVKDVAFLKSFAIYTATILPDPFDPDREALAPERDSVDDPPYADIRGFATQELKDTLVKNWAYHGTQWYVTRGSNRREVVVHIGLKEEEQQHLCDVLDDFFICLRSMPALGDENDQEFALERKSGPLVNGMDMLVF